MNIHYVYLLIDPRTSQPFYVGKGTGNRMYRHVQPCNLKYNPIKAGRIRHIQEAGMEIQYQRIDCDTEHHAFDLEVLLISQYGKICDKSGILTNLDNGGKGGSSGRPITPEVREKLKHRAQGEKTPAGLKRISIANSKPKTDATKKLLQQSSAKAKPIHQVDKTTGEIIATYVSARDAFKQTGIDNVMISRCCTGAYKSAGGFLWKYA